MGAVIPFPRPVVHLWLHPFAGGWFGVVLGAFDREWPSSDATWVPTSLEARSAARALAHTRRLNLLIHADEF